MKIKSIFLLALVALSVMTGYSQKAKMEQKDNKPAVVYFCSEITPENILKLYNALGVEQKGNVGLKVHFGEPGNQNFLNPDLLKPLVER